MSAMSDLYTVLTEGYGGSQSQHNEVTVAYFLETLRRQRGTQMVRVAREQEIDDAIQAAYREGLTPSRSGVIKAARKAGIRVEQC